MNKNLVELQRNSKATAVIILNSDIAYLENVISIEANLKDNEFSNTFSKNSNLDSKLKLRAKLSKIVYLVINNIENLTNEEQEKFVGLIKDRDENGLKLPKNCVIIIGISSENNLKTINPKLYHFCVNAI